MGEDIKTAYGDNVVAVNDIGNGQKELTVKLPELPTPEINKSIASSGSLIDRFGSTTFSAVDYAGNYPGVLQRAVKLPTLPHQQMALAKEIYLTEPIVRTAVDLMVDFSISGFENECDDKEIKKFYDEWCKKVDMDEVLRWIFLEYYRTGNVTVYKSMNKTKMGRPSRKNLKLDDNQLNGKIYPAGYTVLNPQYVYVEGPLLFNQEVIVLRLPTDSQNYLQNGSNPAILDKLPSGLSDAFKSGGQRIQLDQNLVSRITRKRQPYERYAIPFLYSIFEPVIIKQKLKQMDLSTIEGMINQLVTVTVGDKDFPATDEQLQAIAELFSTPNKAYVLFWNHTLKVTFHKPEGLDTLTQDKFAQVNSDILAGLGVSRVLIDAGGTSKGSSGGYSSAWVSILALIERLESGRNQVQRWLENEYKQIAEANGFKTYPSARFNKMNLRQDTTIKNILLAMYDRGLLSLETLLTETNFDFEVELARKKSEQKDSELFLPPTLPYSGQNQGTNSDGKPKTMMPNEGRPPGGENTNNYKKERENPIDPGGDKQPKQRKASLEDYKRVTSSYRDDLEEQYEDLLDETVAVVASKEDDEEKRKKLKQMLGMFFTGMFSLGEGYIMATFDEEYKQFHFNTSFDFVQNRKNELVAWHSKYVDKFVNDISNIVYSNLDSPDEIRKQFSSEQYRIKLFAQEGIRNGFLQGLIAGNISIGSTRATWVTMGDEKVCSHCRDLHGKTFAIEDIPLIPAHVNCRCTLIFE